MKQFYAIKTYKQYDRDVKLAVRRGLDMEKLLTMTGDCPLSCWEDKNQRIIEGTDKLSSLHIKKQNEN